MHWKDWSSTIHRNWWTEYSSLRVEKEPQRYGGDFAVSETASNGTGGSRNRKQGMEPKYLLRFDDICPTMNWGVWRSVEKILLDTDVKPILAVVPDNRDERLKVGNANEGFWEEVRGWQARSWTIGLHGYQ